MPSTEPPATDPPEPPEPAETPPLGEPEPGSRPSRGLPVGPIGLALITLVALTVALLAVMVLFGGRDDSVDVREALGEVDAGPPVPEDAGRAEEGRGAPDVRLDYLDGGRQQLSELRGTPVVLNFWSSTCAPCLQEMPAFEEVHRELGERVAVVGVDVTDTEAAGRKMVERTGVTYRNARDPGADIFAVFGGTALPRTVVLDDAGVVVATHTGALTAQELRDLLRDEGVAG